MLLGTYLIGSTSAQHFMEGNTMYIEQQMEVAKGRRRRLNESKFFELIEGTAGEDCYFPPVKTEEDPDDNACYIKGYN